MNKIEEVRKVTDDKVLEIMDYIHNADISTDEKTKRRLEIAITFFMSSIAMNSEEIAKRYLVHHLLLLLQSSEETIKMRFYGIDTNTCKVTKARDYKEENND